MHMWKNGKSCIRLRIYLQTQETPPKARKHEVTKKKQVEEIWQTEFGHKQENLEKSKLCFRQFDH